MQGTPCYSVGERGKQPGQHCTSHKSRMKKGPKEEIAGTLQPVRQACAALHGWALGMIIAGCAGKGVHIFEVQVHGMSEHQLQTRHSIARVCTSASHAAGESVHPHMCMPPCRIGRSPQNSHAGPNFLSPSRSVCQYKL
mgnify:CR=1 FL=1